MSDILHVRFPGGRSRLVGYPRAWGGTGGAILHRPSPFGSRTSTAMPVKTCLPLARPPRSSPGL